jgi:hypothetical protein
MRILIAIPAVLLLGACQVSKGSNEVSVSYNQDVAENTAAAVGNTAENIASDIGNDVKKTSDKLQNTDVSLKVNTNVSTENKAEKKEK